MWIQFNTNEKRLEDRMITEQTLKNYIENLGHIPASASICVDKINKLPPNEELQFFVNKHNLCWFADKKFLEYQEHIGASPAELFTTNVRDIKLSELL
jgi:hypothetical protein